MFAPMGSGYGNRAPVGSGISWKMSQHRSLSEYLTHQFPVNGATDFSHDNTHERAECCFPLLRNEIGTFSV